MNGIDLALACVLALCALRGYWRGFIRECFALLAVVGGLVAAVRLTATGTVLLREHVVLPTPIDAGVTFVAIFVTVHTVSNVLGVLLDRLAGALFLRAINRVVGAAFAVGKGAAVLAFILLFFHLFPLVPTLDEQIMRSAIGRPLVTAASNVAKLGWPPTNAGAQGET